MCLQLSGRVAVRLSGPVTGWVVKCVHTRTHTHTHTRTHTHTHAHTHTHTRTHTHTHAHTHTHTHTCSGRTQFKLLQVGTQSKRSSRRFER